MSPRTLGHLSPFAAALASALIDRGWAWFPLEGRLRHDESGIDLYFQTGFRALLRLRCGGAVRPYSRRPGAVAAAHEVADKVLACVARAPTSPAEDAT